MARVLETITNIVYRKRLVKSRSFLQFSGSFVEWGGMPAVHKKTAYVSPHPPEAVTVYQIFKNYRPYFTN